jgi:hypothetical protein
MLIFRKLIIVFESSMILYHVEKGLNSGSWNGGGPLKKKGEMEVSVRVELGEIRSEAFSMQRSATFTQGECPAILPLRGYRSRRDYEVTEAGAEIG